MPEEVPEWTWDPEKARLNRRKHGLSFAEAVIALEGPLALTTERETRSDS
ncbi:MAG TPA: BrnT family toxin [Thermoanaerobaculia bacterium]